MYRIRLIITVLLNHEQMNASEYEVGGQEIKSHIYLMLSVQHGRFGAISIMIFSMTWPGIELMTSCSQS